MTVIHDDAFNGCINLESVTFSPRLKWIGNQAFKNCRSIRAVALPGTVQEIGTEAFHSCPNLATFTYPMTLKRAIKGFGRNVFGTYEINVQAATPVLHADCVERSLLSTDVTEGWVPVGVFTAEDLDHFGASIPDYAFVRRLDITSVEIPETAIGIGHSAFIGCHNLNHVAYPSQLERIGHSAFDSCYCISSANLPGSLVEIKDRAFANCRTLASLTFPPGLKTSLKHFGNWVFGGCPLLAADVRQGWSVSLTAEDFEEYGSVIPEMAFCGRRDITSIAFPPSVTVIGPNAFGDCRNLVSIFFPPYLKLIKSGAFTHCAVSHITLPGSLGEIDAGAFHNCKRLKSVVVYRPFSTLYLHGNPFTKCGSIVTISAPDAVIASLDQEPYTDVTTLAALPRRVMGNAFKIQLNRYFWSYKMHRNSTCKELSLQQRAWIKHLLTIGSRARLHWRPVKNGPRSVPCIAKEGQQPLPCIQNDVWLIILTFIKLSDLGRAEETNLEALYMKEYGSVVYAGASSPSDDDDTSDDGDYSYDEGSADDVYF